MNRTKQHCRQQIEAKTTGEMEGKNVSSKARKSEAREVAHLLDASKKFIMLYSLFNLILYSNSFLLLLVRHLLLEAMHLFLVASSTLFLIPWKCIAFPRQSFVEATEKSQSRSPSSLQFVSLVFFDVVRGM